MAGPYGQPWRASTTPGSSRFSTAAPSPFSQSRPAVYGSQALPGEEAWTNYDGLGPVQPYDHRIGPNRDSNWRSGGGAVQPVGYGNNMQIRGLSTSAAAYARPGGGGGRVYRERDNDRESYRRKNKDVSARNNAGNSKRNRWAQSPTRKGVFDDRGEVVDQAYLERNYEPFTKEDYKNAPSSLFSDHKAFLWDSKALSPRSTFLAKRNSELRCTILLHSQTNRGQHIEAVGDGSTKKMAEKIACQHMILKLHQTGELREIIYGGIDPAAFDKDLLSSESDAKMDVYDYCARFNTVPVFTVRHTTATSGRKQSIMEATVEMAEQEIKAVSRARERKVAEILACVEFKRQAENFHAKHGESTIVVKDITALTSRNARKFFEYYKMCNKDVQYDAQVDPISNKSRGGSGVYQGQMMLNDQPLGVAVEMQGKKFAEIAAYLTGAVALKQQDPALFERFIEALRIGNGEILKPISPPRLNVEQDCLLAMTDTLLSVRKIGLPNIEEDEARDRMMQEQNTRRSSKKRSLDQAFTSVKNKKMMEAFEDYVSNPELATLRKKREELPMNQYSAKVLDLVNNNEVSIIVGATGSGKTTQVPQILLEDAIKAGTGAECNIICTQPRRIAATSVAQRVAVERNEPLQKSVGYQVRFDSKLPMSGGSITFCTTGILLQQLRNSADDALDGVTHLLIDEVHERDILIDFLMIILKRVLKERKLAGKPDVKVVLMSATMDTDMFAKYFSDHAAKGKPIPCPHLSVPGRTFPVKEYYLEDIQDMFEKQYSSSQINNLYELETRNYLQLEKNVDQDSRTASRAVSVKEEDDDDDGTEAIINWKQEVNIGSGGQALVSSEKDDALIPVGLIGATMAHIARTTDEGAILIFLPGLQEIQLVDEFIRTRSPLGVNFTDESKYKISMLHSTIPNQNEVFDDVPKGCRKIILSTNIAETSVTIPDVRYVIDTGKMREKQYEQSRRITQLVCTWISRSNSKQRAGRAGRVQDGNYFALFSRARLDTMRAAGLPEMLRSDLQEICLDIKAQGFQDPVAQFLSEAIEPPAPHVIEASLSQLRVLGALDREEKLTPLGKVLATMPVEPALGKMILLGVIFRCLDPIIILGASASAREIFVSPPDKRQEANRCKHSFIRGTGSDHMGMINAFREWREIREVQGVGAANRFAEINFLHRGALRTLDQTANQIEEILVQIGLIPFTSKRERFKSEYGHPRLNDNATSVPLIKALALAGMYPNLAICTSGRGLRTASENFTMIHPSSVHYSSRGGDDNLPYGTLITYSTKAKSTDGNSILLRQNTESTALAALLFGGKLRAFQNTLEIDSWLPFYTHSSALKVTTEFRKCLDRLLGHAFNNLSRRGNNGFLADDPARETFARGLVEVLDRDIKRNERSISRGWGEGRSDSNERYSRDPRGARGGGRSDRFDRDRSATRNSSNSRFSGLAPPSGRAGAAGAGVGAWGRR
ncbi:hypothetical protein RUND412_009758 [Rhizina undulata]